MLHLVCNRLRTSLGLTLESDVKIWNRFAHRDLRDRDGFSRCLMLTLYRPRDILVLLNRAYLQAARSGRYELIEQDVDLSAKEISRDRLEDLFKEYGRVFPGLELFVRVFEGSRPFLTVGRIVEMLEIARRKNDYSQEAASDFAVLNSGEQIFLALYSVGFVGVESGGSSSFRFCHDGAGSLGSPSPDQRAAIHPCYWRALGLSVDDPERSFLVDIHDDYGVEGIELAQDLRLKQLGQLVTELPALALGRSGSRAFEEWVFRSVQILFAGSLKNPELKPNSGAVQQRDIVATNMATSGFWKRVLDDYQARQVIFEVKNTEELRPEDFRQVLSYAGKGYGRFALVVSRSSREAVSENEKAWLREMWHQHNLLILTLPAMKVVQFLRKISNAGRFDYTDAGLNKRLDVFSRSYLSLTTGPRREESAKGSEEGEGVSEG